jgi:NADH-quinone oxidoreductase subunit E
VTEIEKVALSESLRKDIDHWIAKFPADQKRSALLPALRLAQEQMGGHLTPGIMAAIGDYLDTPYVAVYEVATFYSMYEHKPVGRHKICVCTNISCMLKGSAEIVKHLEKRTHTKLGGTSPDGKFTLKKVECMGACVGAPMFQLNDRDYFENLTPEKVDEILSKLE